MGETLTDLREEYEDFLRDEVRFFHRIHNELLVDV